jgi:hypothetical protein
MGEDIKLYKVEKPLGTRALRRPKHRWEDGIKMELKEFAWEGAK